MSLDNIHANFIQDKITREECRDAITAYLFESGCQRGQAYRTASYLSIAWDLLKQHANS